MKLYVGRHLGKRKLKKRLGVRTMRALSRVPLLKPGDVIHTCEGVNRVITTFEPEWRTIGRREVIVDVEILANGGYHSYVHCCEYPPPSVERIKEYWRWWGTPEGRERAAHWGMDGTIRILNAIEAGEELFDERGIPTARYEQLRRGT